MSTKGFIIDKADASVLDEVDKVTQELAAAEAIRIETEVAREEASANPPSGSVTLDTATLLALLQQQSADNRETMLAAIAEMKKPDADSQAKIDSEKARSMDLTLRRIAEAKAQESDQIAAQAVCNHTRPDGKTRLRAQVLSNLYSQAFCPECHYLSAPFACTPHEITGGMNLDGWGPRAYEIVQSRVKASPPPSPVPRIPPGARIIF